MPTKTVPTDESDKAVQWCIEARRLLKLNIIERNSLDLKKRAQAVKSNIDNLKKQFGDTAAQAFLDDFMAIAQRIQTQAGAGNSAQVAIEAERLNVLNKRLLLKLAEKDKNPTKAKTSAQKNLTKAESELEEAQAESKLAYEKALSSAQSKLNLLKPMPFSDSKALADCISKAMSLAILLDWAAAADALSDATLLYEQGKQAAEDWKALSLKHTEQQQHYESKRVKLNEVLEELKPIPGTETFQQTIVTALKNGVDALARPRGSPLKIEYFDNGYQALIALVPSTGKLRKQAMSAAAKAGKDANKDVEVQTAATAARDALGTLIVPGERLVDDVDEDALEADIDTAVVKAGLPGQRDAGLDALRKLKTDLTGKQTSLSRHRTTFIDNMRKADADLKALRYAPTPEDRVALNQPTGQWEAARALASAYDYAEANKLMVPLLKTLQQLLADNDHTPAKLKQRWDEMAGPEKVTRGKPGEKPTASGGELAKARAQVERLRPMLAKNVLPGGEDKSGARCDIYLKFLAAIERRATENNDWAGATKDLSALGREIQQALEQQEAIADFIDDRAGLMAPVNVEIGRAEAAIVKLKTALEGQTDPGNALALAEALLAKARTTWTERAGIATSEATLDAPAAVKAIAAIADQIERQSKSPQALGRAMSAGRDDAAMKAFDALAGEVETELGRLRALSADAWEPHQKTWQDLKYLAFSADLLAPGNPRETMATLKATVLQAISTATTALTDARNAADTRRGEVELQLKTLRKQAESSVRSNVQEALHLPHRNIFAPFFDGLDQDLLDLAGMLASDSVKTLQAALAELNLLAARAAKLKTEIEAQPKKGSATTARTLLDEAEDEEGAAIARLFADDGEPQKLDVKPNFRIVMEAVNALRLRLADKTLARCLPEQKVRLLDEFKTLQSSAFEQEPEAAFVELRQFNERLRKAQLLADTASGLRDDFKEQLTAVNLRFQQLSGFRADTLRAKMRKKNKLKTEPPAYVLELDQRIVAAKAMAKQPQKEAAALKALATILTEIDAVIDADGTVDGPALVEQETKAQQRAFQQKEEKTKWDALVRDFKNMDLARATDAVNSASDGDKSQLTDLQRMLKQAQGLFDDSGSFLGAVELLKAAKQYAQRVIAHPGGLAPSARDELPKVALRWKEAVLAFNRSVDTVAGKIQTAASGDDPSPPPTSDEEAESRKAAQQRQQEAANKSVQLLNGLKTLFNANSMNTPVLVLTNKKVPAADKRAAREQGMKHINGYREVLRSDPVLLKLMQTERPFGTVDFYGLNAALRDLDLNMQRAV